MMQRHARAADFFHQRFATGPDFFQVGWSEGRIGGLGKDEIGHFQIAHRPAVGGGERVDFLGDPQRRFAHLIVRPNVSHDRGIELIAKSNHRVVTHPAGIFCPRENARQHDVGIGRRDQKTEALERIDFAPHPLDPDAEIAISFHR